MKYINKNKKNTHKNTHDKDRSHNKTQKKRRQQQQQRQHDVKNDFYTAVNQPWIDEKSSPKENFEKNYFIQLRHTTNHDLVRIIEKQPHAANIYKVYQSFLQIETKPERMKQKMHDYLLASLDELKHKKTSLMELLGWLSTYGFAAPIQFDIAIDPKKTNQYILEVNHSGVTFDNKWFYANPVNKTPYLHFLNTIFTVLLGPHHNYNMEDIYNIETQIVIMVLGFDNEYTPDKSYHKIYPKQFKGYDFTTKEIAQHIGYPASSLQRGILMRDPHYVQSVMKMMTHANTWKSKSWESYWAYQVIKFYSKRNKKMIPIRETFFDKFYNPRHVNQEERALAFTLTSQSIELNRLYLKHKHNEKARQYCRMLIGKLKSTFRDRLLHNTWLAPQTIQKAIVKLEAILIHFDLPSMYTKKSNRTIAASKFYIYKEPTRQDFEYLEDDPVHNSFCFSQWMQKENIRKISKTPPPRTITSVEPYELNSFDVNAYYMDSKNMIFIPDAILAPPFLDLSQSFSYNLAHIGMILGHEMSHAFDYKGCKFDAHGELKDWWTPHDTKMYQEKAFNVKMQYIRFASRDHYDIHSGYNLSENIADITGFLLAEDVLLKDLIERNTPKEKMDAAFKEFYVQYAKQWRSTLKIKKIQNKLQNDVHSMAKYRVNCVLSRSHLFHTIFEIDKMDGMYYNVNDTIW